MLAHLKSTLYKLLLMTRDYVNKFKKTDASFETVIRNESFFREKFTQFLFSPKGASFQVIISDCDCGVDNTDNDGKGRCQKKPNLFGTLSQTMGRWVQVQV